MSSVNLCKIFKCGEIQNISLTPKKELNILIIYTLCPKKSDAKIQISITMAYLIRIKYPLSGFNYHPSDVNIANFNNIYRTVSEQQLF